MPHAHILSSSLIGGGSMNPDKLALNLQFAADKTLTARKGPTPVFTRGTNATYIGSDGLINNTTGIHQPRFDHDPVTLACKGLLIEESRTNLIWPSDTLTTQTRTVTAVAHTLSFYGTGTVALSGVATATVSGTGAYPTRTTLTFTPTAGSLVLTVTGSVVFAQLEAGSFATSYIPTTTGTVARSADVCSITSNAFTGFYNQSEGTLVTKAASIGYGTLNNNVVAIDNSTTAALRLFNRSTLGFRLSAATTAAQLTPASNYNTVGTFYTSAVAADSTGVDFVIGGSTIANTTSSPTLTATSLKIGETTGASATNNHISSIKYFKKKLSIAKLQTITV